MSRMTDGRASGLGRLAGLVGASGLAVLAGCGGGHGKYTEEHLSVAQEKLAILKSATDYDMSHQSFVAGDLDKALERVDRSIARSEQVAKSHVLRGRILHEMGEMEQAIESFRRAEALEPDNIDAQYYLGVVFERLVERDQAIAHYTRAHELDPANAQYVVAAAELLIDSQRFDEAERMLGDGAYQHNAAVKQTLGHIAQLRGDDAKAVEFFSEARLLAPEDRGIEEDLALALVRTGRFGDAERHLARLLKQDKTETPRRDLMHARARCMVELERFVEARTQYLELSHDYEGASDVAAWIGLGEMAAILKDQARLRDAATRTIALAPDRPEGYVFRAVWSRRQGQLEAALNWLDRAEQYGGSPSVVHPMRALVLRDMGRHDEAERSIVTAAAAHPELAPVAERILRDRAYAGVQPE